MAIEIVDLPMKIAWWIFPWFFFVNVCQRVCLVILASKIASTGGKPNAINFNQLWTDCRKRSHTNGDFGDGILVGFSDDLTLLGLDMS